jgi:hypothetical protein
VIIVPFANADSFVLQAVKRNLDMQGFDYELIDCTDSPVAYPNAVRERWGIGEDLVIVEHDILPGPGSLETFEECSNGWCSFPYVEGYMLAAFLGCTRFRAETMARVNFDWIREDPTWQTLDRLVWEILYDADVRQHVHRPAVVHLHPAYHLTDQSGKVKTLTDDLYEQERHRAS